MFMKQMIKHFIIAVFSAAVLSVLIYFDTVNTELSSSFGGTLSHFFIHAFLLIGLPLALFTDAVHRILHLKRSHTLLTKLGLYAAVVYVSWESVAELAAAMAVYFIIECAFFSVGRTKETTISM
ncbi:MULTISPECIES: hypothetical protein [unclassified Bacillus (in: firmicutes)]|uniref:hypothetical protein n=1 Tax=unclassified Bacillus (in: firmicutes) TaxID=185979 RepID=UPI00228057A3|nr:hypothetical protein [Bacillus sp. S20C3]MCY8288956.1 hypothetical protein [Bacillus sp. N13C7]MCY8638139.1 hypothetical protein [Bacillus sp. S17B2]MCY9142036.1 hypothetical protein [Bacillus sp. T9C1]